jgi:hypothetical protein
MEAGHNTLYFGIIIIIVVVFVVLFLIYLTYNNVNKLQNLLLKKGTQMSLEKQPINPLAKFHSQSQGNSSEVAAAIAVAMYLSQNQSHTFNNYKLTGNSTEKIYSPWSSKIYGLRQVPVKIKTR